MKKWFERAIFTPKTAPCAVAHGAAFCLLFCFFTLPGAGVRAGGTAARAGAAAAAALCAPHGAHGQHSAHGHTGKHKPTESVHLPHLTASHKQAAHLKHCAGAQPGNGALGKSHPRGGKARVHFALYGRNGRHARRIQQGKGQKAGRPKAA